MHLKCILCTNISLLKNHVKRKFDSAPENSTQRFHGGAFHKKKPLGKIPRGFSN
jgi:hypothetical protein